MVTSFYTKLLRKEQITPDAYIFYFHKPKSFTYQAGQYIKMYLDIEKPDSRGVTRYFTLSSSPTEEYLKVTTRILKSTFKKTLGNLKPGVKVKMRGPWGDFVLSPEKHKKLVFLSGGIGLTPYRSMIKYVTDNNNNIYILIIASFTTPDEIFFEKELTEISSIYKNIKTINTITHPEDTEWKGEAGRINPEMIKRHLEKPREYIYYCSGPEPFVYSLTKMLRGMKIPKANILTDEFPGYK